MNFLQKYFAWSFLVIISFICAGAIFFYWWHFKSYTISNNPSSWGVFGDYIGGIIGTILGFGTIVFIILTLQSQNKTKNDNFFFYLLQLHEHHIANFKGKMNNETFEGKLYYRKLLEECCIVYHIHNDERKVYAIMEEVKNLFSSYMTNLNEIVKFIQHSNKYSFTDQSNNFKNLLIAQLSNDERIILGYMCALDILSSKEEFYKFYLDHKIHKSINYEPSLLARNKKPDAIKIILDKLG